MKHKCPVCDNLTIKNPGSFELCPICNWEDDNIQRKKPDFEGGANEESLNQAREAYQKKRRKKAKELF